ncbi:MAG: PA2779 family protein [Syntrophaceae bacterium]|nr:PA2779 family protein [Syntrophaceae bacterium]
MKEKLKAHGLNPGEIEQKLQGLSDGQIHVLAQASDRVPGGDALGVVIAILVIILLVILILKLSDKSIVIK